MISLIFTLVFLGLVMYLVENFIPMSPPFKTVIRVIVVLCLVLYLLRVFGVADIALPRAH